MLGNELILCLRSYLLKKYLKSSVPNVKKKVRILGSEKNVKTFLKKSALRAKVKKVPQKALNVLKIKSGTLKKNSGASRRQKG